MTFQELLILFGAPILVVVAVFAVIFLRHPRPQSRYRLGEPYSFKPVWFIARDGAVGAAEGGAAGELEAAQRESGAGPKGGAHGKW